MIIDSNKFKIKFLHEIKKAMYFLYKVEIECKKTGFFKIDNIRSMHFTSCTDLNFLGSYRLINNLYMKSTQKIIGYIAFKKNIYYATNQPIIFLENKKYKINCSKKEGEKP